MRPAELLIDGVSEDACAYRDTIFLLVDDGDGPLEAAVAAAVRHVCTTHELTLTELALADESVWDGSGARPATTDRAAFLAAVDVLPAAHEAFSCPAVFIDLHDPDWADCGAWL